MRNQSILSGLYKSTFKLMVLIVSGMICFSILVGAVDYSGAKTVTLSKNGVESVITTFAGTVGDLLASQKIEVADAVISENADSLVTDGMTLDVKTRRTMAVTETRDIEYKQVRVANSNMATGETKVTQSGQMGIAEDVYSVDLLGDEVIEKTLVSSAVKKEPVNEIVEYGTKNKSDKGFTYSKMITVKATAYESTFGSRNGKPGITASGLPLAVGMIAVDPRVIPLGTKVYIEDPNGVYNYGYAIAADTGGAIKGNRIDVCVPTYNDAIQFGVRYLNVYVLE